VFETEALKDINSSREHFLQDTGVDFLSSGYKGKRWQQIFNAWQPLAGFIIDGVLLEGPIKKKKSSFCSPSEDSGPIYSCCL
jgi:hypothetical protein